MDVVEHVGALPAELYTVISTPGLSGGKEHREALVLRHVVVGAGQQERSEWCAPVVYIFWPLMIQLSAIRAPPSSSRWQGRSRCRARGVAQRHEDPGPRPGRVSSPSGVDGPVLDGTDHERRRALRHQRGAVGVGDSSLRIWASCVSARLLDARRVDPAARPRACEAGVVLVARLPVVLRAPPR